MRGAVFELAGPGWGLSFQRCRAEPVQGGSANLGAAPFRTVARKSDAWRLMVALATGEAFWVCVRAAEALPATVTLEGGDELRQRVIAAFENGETMRRFEPPKPLPSHCAPPIADLLAPMTIRIGATIRIVASTVVVPTLDQRGPDGAPSEPAVYGGWRMP